MLKELNQLNCIHSTIIGHTQIYHFDSNDFPVYLITSETSRKLLVYPELMGVDIPNSLYQATADFLLYLYNSKCLGSINIVNILRGGLNFPLETACTSLEGTIPTVSFLSSERMSNNTEVLLRMKYKKVLPSQRSSILIGDIIASGSTLINTIKYLALCYDNMRVSPRNIIVFTIGTYKTLEVLNHIDKQLRARWPNFEGVIPVFYEAIFNIYESIGVTGLNTIGLDFYLSNAFILPQMRSCYIDRCSAIFEKCAIYDGGDRRFNPVAHMKLICEYWNKVKNTSKSDVAIFLKEKMGYDSDISFDSWINQVGYDGYDYAIDINHLYKKEMKMIKNIINCDFNELCSLRLKELKTYFKERVGHNCE